MENNEKIKILITDDHKVMRDGLKLLFSNYPQMAIVGEADNLETTEQIVNKAMPDIITIGMNIEGSNYIDFVKNLSREYPYLKIIAHSAYKEKTFVSEVLKAGSHAYVHKKRQKRKH